MWKLEMSDDERIPLLRRYMSGRLTHLYPMRPGKTKRDKRARERKCDVRKILFQETISTIFEQQQVQK